MTLFKIDIEKHLFGEYWTNRYVVNYPTINDAYNGSAFILDVEQDVHYSAVDFTKLRVSDFIANNDTFITIPTGGSGRRTVTSDRLPLFNVVRVDFGAGFGSPSRKYLRGILVEGDTSFNDLTPAFVTFMTTNYVQQLVPHAPYVDVDGQDINTGTVWPLVAMRQLRRGSRRRAAPII
jgi:hypothetical protein